MDRLEALEIVRMVTRAMRAKPQKGTDGTFRMHEDGCVQTAAALEMLTEGLLDSTEDHHARDILMKRSFDLTTEWAHFRVKGAFGEVTANAKLKEVEDILDKLNKFAAAAYPVVRENI